MIGAVFKVSIAIGILSIYALTVGARLQRYLLADFLPKLFHFE
jgi:hypothetical protein